MYAAGDASRKTTKKEGGRQPLELPASFANSGRVRHYLMDYRVVAGYVDIDFVSQDLFDVGWATRWSRPAT